ncbi:MAG: MBL fold metallo-hydrolase [Fuerstiella sp.]|nr:MBL fold metallo-hydrolase [Fuerstiella sp.]
MSPTFYPDVLSGMLERRDDVDHGRRSKTLATGTIETMRTFPGCVPAIWLSCLACVPIAADDPVADAPYVAVLGVAQDAGFPQAGCRKKCCQAAWNNNELRRYAACLAIVDPLHGQRWLIDCTPDFREQLRTLEQLAPKNRSSPLDGILLTHAHIGHYAGLIHLGREVMGANGVPVYAMPGMRRFLEENDPWEQLLRLEQITIQELTAGQPVNLNRRPSWYRIATSTRKPSASAFRGLCAR